MLNLLDCKTRAAECERMAEQTLNPGVRAILHDMARAYVRLAIEAENAARLRAPPLQLIVPKPAAKSAANGP